MFFKMLIIMKLEIVVIFISQMSRLSFHTPSKTCCKMQNMVRAMYVQVREKSGKGGTPE